MNANTQIDGSGAVLDPVPSDPVYLDDSPPQPPADDSQRTVLDVLLELQAKYGSFGKDSAGHGYRFLSLGKMLKQLRPDLAANRCLLISSSRFYETVFIVKSTLLHLDSGTEMSVEWATPFAEQKANSNAQVTGGYETYGRRYNLMKLLNCDTEDNDAADIWRETLADCEDKAESRYQVKVILSQAKQKFLKINKKDIWLNLAEYCNEHLCPNLPERVKGDPVEEATDADSADK